MATEPPPTEPIEPTEPAPEPEPPPPPTPEEIRQAALDAFLDDLATFGPTAVSRASCDELRKHHS